MIAKHAQLVKINRLQANKVATKTFALVQLLVVHLLQVQHVQLMVPLNVRLVLRLKNFPHLIVVKPAILVNIKIRMATQLAVANTAWLDFISLLRLQVAIPVPLECIKHQILLVVQRVLIVPPVFLFIPNLLYVKDAMLANIKHRTTKIMLGVLDGPLVQLVKKVRHHR